MSDAKHTCLLHVMLDLTLNDAFTDWWFNETIPLYCDCLGKQMSDRKEAVSAEADTAMSPRRVPGRARWVLWLVFDADDRAMLLGSCPPLDMLRRAQELLVAYAEEDMRRMGAALADFRERNLKEE